MPKCKKCDDTRELTWDKVHHESTGKWRLWDNDRDRPHECSGKKKDKKRRSSYSSHYGFNGNNKDDLWKKDWTPEMDLPSFRMCGVCNNGTLLLKNPKYECRTCVKILHKICDEYCPNCKTHPRIVLVTRDRETRLGS